jgi:hypothetical protein
MLSVVSERAVVRGVLELYETNPDDEGADAELVDISTGTPRWCSLEKLLAQVEHRPDLLGWPFSAADLEMCELMEGPGLDGYVICGRWALHVTPSFVASVPRETISPAAAGGDIANAESTMRTVQRYTRHVRHGPVPPPRPTPVIDNCNSCGNLVSITTLKPPPNPAGCGQPNPCSVSIGQ